MFDPIRQLRDDTNRRARRRSFPGRALAFVVIAAVALATVMLLTFLASS